MTRVKVHGGSNSWEKPTASSTKMEQWSATLLPIGKPRVVDYMGSMFWGWVGPLYFEGVVSAYAEPYVIGNDPTKLYTM